MEGPHPRAYGLGLLLVTTLSGAILSGAYFWAYTVLDEVGEEGQEHIGVRPILPSDL